MLVKAAGKLLLNHIGDILFDAISVVSVCSSGEFNDLTLRQTNIESLTKVKELFSFVLICFCFFFLLSYLRWHAYRYILKNIYSWIKEYAPNIPGIWLIED